MKTNLSHMTLREKIGQTGMPSPGDVKKGVVQFGGYANYFHSLPFCGLYLNDNMEKDNGECFDTANSCKRILSNLSSKQKLPIFIACDAEQGGKDLFPELHLMPTIMSIGAANSPSLSYQRCHFWARELLTCCGVNWIFGPVCDIAGGFFSPSGVRCLSDDANTCKTLLPEMIKGLQEAGVAATAKHYPGHGKDYRDPHFCMSVDNTSKKQWDDTYRGIWQATIDAGVYSVMVGHTPVPSLDDSFSRGKSRRPASASKKIIDILREELHFDGVILTDAVNMKGLAASFSHDDVYIETFNAGNDIVLFCHNDYIDVMEKAVLDGKVSEKDIDKSVERILALKEKLGLFENKEIPPLHADEIKEFEKCNYEIAKNAITLINNENNLIPFDKNKVKRVTIIKLSPYPLFLDTILEMKKIFESKGIHVTVLESLRAKETLEELSQSDDIIIYACFLAQSYPPGMSFYSSHEDIITLFNGMSYGAEKSVVASFGATSIYYNYFETVDAFINAYSINIETIRAFVDGLLGEISFVGKSPVKLAPEFAQ